MTDHNVRGGRGGHVALNRHKLGSWNTLLDFLPNSNEIINDGSGSGSSTSISSTEQKDDDGNANIFVSRLNENYMGLYGQFPESDKFSAVVCDCGSIVKPQGLRNHLARNHSSTNGGTRGLKSDYYSNYSGGLTSSSNSNNGSSSRSGTVIRDKDNNYSSSNSPASSTGSTPVKNPEDFSGILPNSNVVVKHKHKHSASKSKSKSKSNSIVSNLQQQSQSAHHHSSDSQPSASDQKLPEFLVNATSTSLDSSTYTFSNASKLSGAQVTVSSSSSSSNTNKSQSKNRHRHSTKHDKGKKSSSDIYDPDKHCGVISQSEDAGKPCVRSFSCKIHSNQQRRDVKGRTRTFDSLLAEYGGRPEPEIISIDLESNSSSCSSILEKPNNNVQDTVSILSEEATMRLKEQIELPTIVLRKLEHDVVQGMDTRTIAELLEKNAIVMKKEEPIQLHETITVMDATSGEPDQIPPQELFELISQVEEQTPTQNILTMTELTNLVEESNKNQVDMFQMGAPMQQLHTELHCRTIAFPLSVFYLMKNNMLTNSNTFTENIQHQEQPDIKFGNTFQTTLDTQNQQYFDPTNNQLHNDFSMSDNVDHTQFQHQFQSKPSHDLLSNILTLQEMVPLMPDNYCDVYSKVCDQNLLSDCSNLFPMLSSVHENENLNSNKQYEHDDYRSIKSCLYPNLPKPSTVNTFGLKRVGGGATISRKALYLRKTLLKTKDSDKKFKLKTEGTNYAATNVQSPHGMLLTSSAAVNKGRKRSFLASTVLAKQKSLESNNEMLNVLGSGSGHRLGNAFTNDANKIEIDPNLDEILQPKRQLFVQRY
uniref:CSON000364 protein n=1 Tax=Culicoides sonorensis TaxID=179676 RepID=A0A336KYS4_CULSO